LSGRTKSDSLSAWLCSTLNLKKALGYKQHPFNYKTIR
jgi:hypothetical protein